MCGNVRIRWPYPINKTIVPYRPFKKGDPIRVSGSFLKTKHMRINLITKNCISEVSSVYDI